jgi:hypothetical protein
MRTTWIVVILCVTVGLTAPVAAQEDDFRAVANPFGEGFAYRIGEDLAPNVDVEGVRWMLVRIATKGDREIQPHKVVPVTVDLELDNRREESVRVLVALMLESAEGDSLESLSDDSIHLEAGRLKQVRSKFRVAGDSLLATSGLYLFCELQEK